MCGMKDWWLLWWWWWGIAGDDGNVGDAGDDDDGVGDGTDRLKAVFCAVRQWLRFQLHREAGAGWDELFSTNLKYLIYRCKERVLQYIDSNDTWEGGRVIPVSWQISLLLLNTFLLVFSAPTPFFSFALPLVLFSFFSSPLFLPPVPWTVLPSRPAQE